MNELLSICIPTYNRAAFLRTNLLSLISQVEKYNIPIYVSDNASTDDTRLVVKEIQRSYPYLNYYCNDRNYGPDYNITQVLKMSKSKYAWFLGDDDIIVAGGVDTVMEIVKNADYDLVIVNGGQIGKDRVKGIKSSVYKDRNHLLVDLGWHNTWMSCLILSSRMIKNGLFEKYIGTYLVHVGTIFNYLSDRDFSVFWCADRLIDSMEGNVSSWTEKTFDIWIENWIKIINSLPSTYTDEAKLKCIKDHGMKSEVFSLRHFFCLRASNIYNYRIYSKFYKHFKYVTDVPIPVLLSASLMPLWLMKLIHSLWKAYKCL